MRREVGAVRTTRRAHESVPSWDSIMIHIYIWYCSNEFINLNHFFWPNIAILGTVAIKSIRRSQVTGPLNLTKSHRGHTKNGKKSQNMVQKRQIFLQITIKISKYSNLMKP